MVSVDEEDGTNVLYCNARSPLAHRVQALSLDDGAVFQEGQLVQKLVEPRNGCHGSIVGFPAPFKLYQDLDNHLQQRVHHSKHWTSCMAFSNHTKSACTCSTSSITESPYPDFLTPTWVVYSHPTGTTERKDLGIFLSLFPRDPDSWHGPWVIYEGPSAYSDLAYLEVSPSAGEPPVVAFACLFECGTKTAYDEISFSIFTLHELINNIPQDVRLINLDELCVMKRRKKRKLVEMCCVS